jgi:hypothetical protein
MKKVLIYYLFIYWYLTLHSDIFWFKFENKFYNCVDEDEAGPRPPGGGRGEDGETDCLRGREETLPSERLG